MLTLLYRLFTPLVAKKFDILPDILIEPILLSTPVYESIFAKRVYRNFPIMFPNRVSYVDLLELNILDFNIILSMDWLHACFASIEGMTRVVRFNFPIEPVAEWKGVNSIPTGHIISNLKACKMISNDCLYNIVRVKDLDSEVPPIESILIVSEFEQVFPNDLHGIHPEREIYFCIDLRIEIPYQ